MVSSRSRIKRFELDSAANCRRRLFVRFIGVGSWNMILFCCAWFLCNSLNLSWHWRCILRARPIPFGKMGNIWMIWGLHSISRQKNLLGFEHYFSDRIRLKLSGNRAFSWRGIECKSSNVSRFCVEITSISGADIIQIVVLEGWRGEQRRTWIRAWSKDNNEK